MTNLRTGCYILRWRI